MYLISYLFKPQGRSYSFWSNRPSFFPLGTRKSRKVLRGSLPDAHLEGCEVELSEWEFIGIDYIVHDDRIYSKIMAGYS